MFRFVLLVCSHTSMSGMMRMMASDQRAWTASMVLE